MSTPDAAAPSESRGPETEPTRGGVMTSPIAVVWCRQVDNEAESPGYTTVPEDFPGHRETLEVIRAVGHLTINVADTHDYWDPDPAQPLSYYPNLFLYPAYGGRYICLGRMFLSTEDRPRLGMKTLVLDTAQLLASGDFGGTLLRWHASMGGPRRDGGRGAALPDPGLYNVLGEGLLFHRGATDPVVVVASDNWEPAMQAVLDLVRLMPASLVALGAILCFPYFLPQAKTNLHEFAEQLPLALALMRIPKGEAAGDRHAKRMASWEGAPVTVRDISDGVPSVAKTRENLPLVLQFARDHQDAKLLAISQRVDLVETPRLRAHLADPERQGGRDRRKEMWRIGTAMESAALLLQRSRGRHVPVNVETAKRAQEYIQARVPESVRSPAPPEPAVVAAAPAGPPTVVPPWLQRTEGPAVPPPTATAEVVPVSVSDDPSLLRAPAPPPLGAKPLPPAPATPAASPRPSAPLPPAVAAAQRAPATLAPEPARPAAPSIDVTALKLQIEQDLLRLLEQRIATLARPSPSPAATALDPRLQAELDARTEAKLLEVQKQSNGQIANAVAALEAKLDGRTEAKLLDTQSQSNGQISTAVAALEAKMKDGQAAAIAAELDRRLAAEVDRRVAAAVAPQIVDLSRRLDESVQSATASAREQIAAESGAAAAAGEERQRRAVAEQLQAESARAREAIHAAVVAEVDQRTHETIEDRVGELARRIDDAVKASAASAQEEARGELGRAVEALRGRVTQAEAELEKGILAQVDLQLREAREDTESARVALQTKIEAALKTAQTDADARRLRDVKELEQRLNLLVDGRTRETHEKVDGIGAQLDDRLAAAVDERVAAAEGRVAARFDGQLTEAQEARVHGIADLQVRLQSYFDQRLREEQERERQKYLELLARLKGEVDTSLARMVESARFDTSLREKIGRSLEMYRADLQRTIDSKLASAEQKLAVDRTEVTEQLTRIEQSIEERRAEMTKLEETVRGEVDDLDRRTQILADRLVPVVRKTWLRVVDLQKGGGGDSEVAVNQLRRELHRELQRVEGEVVERTTEIRTRMESAISNQGRVWLTLIRQLSQLTDDRRALEQGRALLTNGLDRQSADIGRSLETLPNLFPPRGATDEPVNPLDPDDEEESPPAATAREADRSTTRRRFRRPSR